MSPLVQQLLVVVAALGLVFAGPFAAMAMLLRRKRATRIAKRSPLTKDLLRAPGRGLRQRLDDKWVDMSGELAVLMLVPPLMAGVLLAQAVVTGRLPSPLVAGGVGVAVVLFTGVTVRRMLLCSAEMDRLRLGLDAELAVGQELDQLMRRGAVVFNDRGNAVARVAGLVRRSQGRWRRVGLQRRRARQNALNGRSAGTERPKPATGRLPTRTAQPHRQAEIPRGRADTCSVSRRSGRSQHSGRPASACMGEAAPTLRRPIKTEPMTATSERGLQSWQPSI